MNMALLQEWRDYAYKFDDRTAEGQQFWLNYFNIEKGIYEQLLADKDTVVSGTVKELADKYETELQMFAEVIIITCLSFIIYLGKNAPTIRRHAGSTAI